MSSSRSPVAVRTPDTGQAVARAYERIAESERGEIWISLRDREEVLGEARQIAERHDGGEALPLAGKTLAVKDNIDVAGTSTTAGCPDFAYLPAADAPAIAALRRAGAIVLGKTNLDQFATGLVGTRSPYGPVRDARDPRRVSGGSSSGSAVAVALGLADIGIATDTAGSGRVPAAFQGIFGIKLTGGLVSTEGVVPACRSFDCVSLLCADLDLAETALASLLATADAGRWPERAPLGAPERPHLAIPPVEQLGDLSPATLRAWHAALERAEEVGMMLTEVDLAPFWHAGELLYGGALVAERYAAVGGFIAEHGDAVDPSVASIILAAGEISAARFVADSALLGRLRSRASATLKGFDGLLLPTAPFQPTIAEVQARPIEINRELGRYTTFCNPLGMCAVALPAGEVEGGHFGISVLAPAYHDRAAFELAARLHGNGPAEASPRPAWGPPAIRLLVVGAHLHGQPLNGELLARGAVLVGPARTSGAYGLYRLDTVPRKPGLVRRGRGQGGAAIEGEVWALPPAGLADLLAELPRPMTFGHVELEDGGQVLGFLCEPEALEGAVEITRHGGWRAYLEAAET